MSSKPLVANVVSADVQFVDRRLDMPLRLASGTITEITEARATVHVRCAGIDAEGRGSIYLSDVWAWPDPAVPHVERDARLRELCTRIARELRDLVGQPAHPLELGLRLHDTLAGEAAPDGPPLLARILCGAPFDAAIHDAVGRAMNRSAFALYDAPAPIPSADAYFPDGDAVAAIRRTLRSPLPQLQAWWVLGRDDDPAAEKGAIVAGGYRAFKLKLLGGPHPRDDVEWTAKMYERLRGIGVADPILSADANGGFESAAAVAEYLDELKEASPKGYAALQYLEQPTSWDLASAAFDWRPVAARKPVVADEGLTGLETLPILVEQGWSGIALKTCKGHSLSLVAAAWGRERGMLLTMQDLTNPGLAAIHAALFASYVHTVNGVELNSPQYTPKANEEWLPRLAGLFKPSGGKHSVPDPHVPGLGSEL